MRILTKALRIGACAALVATSSVHAANIVAQSTDLGPLGQQSGNQSILVRWMDDYPLIPGVQLSGVPGDVLPTDTLYSDFAFQISGPITPKFWSVIETGYTWGVTEVQARLYKGTLQTATTGSVGSALLVDWGTPLNPPLEGTYRPGSEIVTSAIDLQPGNYVLELRGHGVASYGGEFSADLVFSSPVPEADAMTMALVGLAALCVFGRRRESTALGVVSTMAA